MIETINPWLLPRLPFPDRVKLPDRPGLYFVLEGEELIYIGKASNSLKARWSGKSHHKALELLQMDSVKIAYTVPFGIGDEELKDLERQAIAHWKPRLNVVGKQVTDIEVRARLYDSDKRRMDVACGALGRSANSIIEEAIQSWLEEHWPEVEIELKKLSPSQEREPDP